MKKIISLVLIFAVLCVACFSLIGCSKPVAKNESRWKVGETFTYNVSLQGALAPAGAEDTADFLLQDAENVYQVKPLSVSGTYITTVSDDAENPELHVFTTSLTLLEVYSRDVFTDDSVSELRGKGVATENVENNTVTIITTVATSCHFKYNATKDFPPTKSTRSVKGAYIGKEVQVVNNYTINCTYRYEKKTYCDVTYTNVVNPTLNSNYTVRLKGSVYDNELIMLRVRSYDMSSLISAGATLSVMDPLFEKGPATLTLQASKVTSETSDKNSSKRYLTDTFAVDSLTCVIANANSTDIKSYSALVFYFDTQHTYNMGGVSLNSNAMLKFQQGYLVYTLNNEGLTKLGYTGS